MLIKFSQLEDGYKGREEKIEKYNL